MEQMAEQVAGSHYQRLHHMLSESNWSRAEVRQQLIGDANAHFGYGVAPQWNGRLCKTENSQVGVFAALMRDRACALVDGELFVPEHWFDDPQRCQEAGIPETLEFRTKSEMLWLCCCVWLTNRINTRRSIIQPQRNVHRNFGGLFGMIDL
jgi:SRSO17 transposase